MKCPNCKTTLNKIEITKHIYIYKCPKCNKRIGRNTNTKYIPVKDRVEENTDN